LDPAPVFQAYLEAIEGVIARVDELPK